jgi:hypothetical protein
MCSVSASLGVTMLTVLRSVGRAAARASMWGHVIAVDTTENMECATGSMFEFPQATSLATEELAEEKK